MLCFIFLANALWRIRSVMNQVKGVQIIMQSFVMYAVLAALAIFGQIPVIFVGFLSKVPAHVLATITITNNVIIMIFQILLIVILNKLLSSQKPTRFVK